MLHRYSLILYDDQTLFVPLIWLLVVKMSSVGFTSCLSVMYSWS